MLRLGVVGRGPTLDRELAGTSARGRRFSLTLLRELTAAWNPSDEALLDRLYQELVVAGKVHKTTRRDRFCELDTRLMDDLETRFPDATPLRIHDVGASNAITSLQLFRQLSARRPVHVHASDWFDCLYFVQVRGRSWTTVLDADGEPAQYVGHGLVLSALRLKNTEGRRFPVNWLIKRWLDRTLLPHARSALAQALGGSVTWTSPESRSLPRATVTRLPLMHPECAAALRTTKAFTYGRHDAFQPTTEVFHCVRALNFLNPGYFDPSQVARGVRACALGLLPGGLLIIGRTMDESDGHTRATAFVRKGGTLEPVWDLNEGSEIRDLASAVPVE